MTLQVATERIIERLEKEGGHNEDFLAEFRTFRSELRDFFNASSLTDMLAALRPSLDEPDMQVNWQVSCLDGKTLRKFADHGQQTADVLPDKLYRRLTSSWQRRKSWTTQQSQAWTLSWMRCTKSAR